MLNLKITIFFIIVFAIEVFFIPHLLVSSDAATSGSDGLRNTSSKNTLSNLVSPNQYQIKATVNSYSIWEIDTSYFVKINATLTNNDKVPINIDSEFIQLIDKDGNFYKNTTCQGVSSESGWVNPKFDINLSLCYEIKKDVKNYSYLTYKNDFECAFGKSCKIGYMPITLNAAIVFIQGKYANENPNFEFTMPEGWFGIRLEHTPNMILIIPGQQSYFDNIETSPFTVVAGTITKSEISSSYQDAMQQEINCKSLVTYHFLNKIPVREVNESCAKEISKTYWIALQNDKFLRVGINEKSPSQDNEKNFAKLITTLQVDSPLPIKQNWRKAINYDTYTKNVTLDGKKPIVLEYQSDSKISEFNYDSKIGQIILTLTENDKTGGISIPISKIIQKPYQVTVDGKIIEFDLIDDQIEGITEMVFDYQKGTHTVKITGSQLTSSPIPTNVEVKTKEQLMKERTDKIEKAKEKAKERFEKLKQKKTQNTNTQNKN